jgi:hypothetical protein
MRSFVKSTTAAATATSGAIFALQPHTEAAVIYSGLQNVSVSVDRSTVQSRGLNLGHSGADFNLVLFRSTYRLHPSLQANNGNAGFLVNGSRALAKLAAGQLVSAGKAFFSSAPHGLLWSNAGGHKGGTWAQSQPGFAGVMFSVFHSSNSTTSKYLGWIRLEWTDVDNTETLTAIDWAYNNTAGASILTGQGIPAPTPEPSRALLLLAGAGSMALRRRRRMV